MKQIEKWQKQYATIDKTKAGYSDVRLWPCCMIFSSLILFLGPLLGVFWALVLVTIPATYIAVKAAKTQNSNLEAVARYRQGIRDMYAVIEEKDGLKANTPAIKTETKVLKLAKQRKPIVLRQVISSANA